jgi:hypothetical protein
MRSQHKHVHIGDYPDGVGRAAREVYLDLWLGKVALGPVVLEE